MPPSSLHFGHPLCIAQARPFLLESTLLAALLAKTPVIAPAQTSLSQAPGPSTRLLNQPSLTPHHLTASGYFSEALAGQSVPHSQNANTTTTNNNNTGNSAPPTANQHNNAHASSSIPGALVALLPSTVATNTCSTRSLDRTPRGTVGTTTSCGSFRALPGATTTSFARLYRVESTAHACVNSYMEDEEQPAGDVWLLLKRAGAGAAGGVSGAAGGLQPSSSLQPVGAVAGGGAFGERGSAVVGGGGPVSLVLAASAVPVPSAPAGADSSVLDSMATGQGGVGMGTGGMGAGTYTTALSLERFQALRHSAGRPAGPCDGEAALLLAVYVTAGERLPASLLRAARGRAHSLLEVGVTRMPAPFRQCSMV